MSFILSEMDIGQCFFSYLNKALGRCLQKLEEKMNKVIV